MPKRRSKRSKHGASSRPRAARSPRTRASGARARAQRTPTATDLQKANRELIAQLRAVRTRQRTLERTHAEYAVLFDFAPVTYALLDSVGVVANVNQAACRLLNLERKHLVGHPLLDFVLADDRGEFLEHLRRCGSGTRVVESEVRLAPRDRKPVICRVYSKRARYGNRDAVPTVLIDQTERLSLDQARLAAEWRREEAERDARVAKSASAAKDRFLATVSHELRTPLTPALFAASRLAVWEGIPREARKLAETIQRNVEYEARLIDDLLDVARVNRERITLKLETVDVHDVVGDALRICQPFAEARRVAVSSHLLAPNHHVSADRTRLRQVFWNLLNNAIKFTEAGGRIVVRSAVIADETVQVSIRDTGAGMDRGVLEHLFAPFDRDPGGRNSRGGLGLGLAICKGLVGAHGGQIWASSDGPGCGSTFSVELATVAAPAHASPPQEPAPAAALPGAGSSRVRILIVEDDPDSGEMLSMCLSRNGYDVHLASSVRKAISRLAEDWDIVLSDIGLPDGSGLEIARHARRQGRPPRKLIAFTGYGSTDDITASREAGFDDHVVKPIDLDRLVGMLNGQTPTRERANVLAEPGRSLLLPRRNKM